MVLAYSLISCTAVAALAYALYYYWKNKEHFSWSDVVLWSVQGLIFFCLVIPMTVRLGFTAVWFQYLTQTRRFAEHLVFVPWVMAYFLLWAGGSLLLARKKISHLWFCLLFFLPLFFLFRFLFLYFIDSKPYSDFETYWLIAQENVKAGKLLSQAQTANGLAKLTYCRRAVVIWTPLVWLFGPEPIVYKTANVVMQLLTFLMAYRIAVRHFGKRAAQLGIWFVLFVPELILSCAVPTHDLNAMFLLFGYFFAIDEVVARLKTKQVLIPIVLSVVAGVLWLAVDLQRSYGPFILLGTIAFCGTVVASQLPELLDKVRRKDFLSRTGVFLLLVLVVPWSVHIVSEQILLRTTGLKGTVAVGAVKIVHTSIDNWDGRYTAMDNMKNYFKAVENSAQPEQSRAYWKRYYNHMFLSSYMHNHLRYIPQWMNRTNGLLSLGRDITFYFSHLKPSSPIAPHYKSLRGLYFLSDLFTLLFLSLCVLGLGYALKNRLWDLYSYLPILFVAIMIPLILVFGEIQARYSYPVWPILPLFLGKGLEHFFGREKKEKPSHSHLSWGIVVVLASVCFGFLGVMGAYAFSSQKLLNMKEWTVHTTTEHSLEEYYSDFQLPDGTIQIAPEKHWAPLPGRVYSNNNLRLQLRFGKEPVENMQTAAQRVFSLKPGVSYMLRGVLESTSQKVMSKVKDGDFVVTVWCNGEMMYSCDFKGIGGIHYVRIPGFTADSSGRAEILLCIRANRDYEHDDWKAVGTVAFSHFQLVPEQGS